MRVLVVGQGLIGRKRAIALGPHLVGTVDPVAPGLPNIAHWTNIEDACDCDAVIIAVPHDLAPPIALDFLWRGIPILMEKPLGLKLTDAEDIHDAAAKLDRPSFVGYNYRFLPHVRRLFDLDLGRLRSIDLLLGYGTATEDWKLLPECGGGALVDVGSHLVDLLLQIMPNANQEDTVSTSGFWDTGVVEECLSVFGSGQCIATVRASLIRWVNTFRVEVFGEDGYAIVEGRGGNYGPMTLRVGKRWGWQDSGSQRDSEIVQNFGMVDCSLENELAAVIAQWEGKPISGPQPATMAEALRVAECVAF